MSTPDATQIDQLDLFSQALFMLDEVNKDVEEPVADDPLVVAEAITEDKEPKSLSRPSTPSVKPTFGVQPVASDTGVGSTPVMVNPVPTFSQLPDGRIVVTQSSHNPGLISLLNSNYQRGIIRNGSAPVLSGKDQTVVINNGLPHSLSTKDVSRMWSNEAVDIRSMSPVTVISSTVKVPDVDEEAEEDEELGVAETYADYMPSKVKIGIRHPDPVVETSSLSSVEPPDVWYSLSIPMQVIDSGELSALQLEAITYTCQKHETYLAGGERAGFLIGDGAGVGKGRTVAGIIYENYLCGRKRALWFSVSNDLKVDAERDLGDIGASKIPVYALNKFKYAKISSVENGSVKKGVIFATYSSLIGESTSNVKYRTRLKMLLNWCGADYDGVIVFDECHKAKNLCPSGSSKPTKTGLCVQEIQQKLPKARVVYASATGASEPRNMAYMTRLGLWGPGTSFSDFNGFIQAVEKRGVGAMELVAMDMKLRGMYIARQLSFHGVSFNIEDIPVPKDYVKIYNSSVRLWVDARNKFQEAAELIDAENSMRKSMWGQFWSAHQRFFKYLCISSKVNYAVKIAKEALKQGKCVVIGLQSTGEARTLEQLESMDGEINDFVSTAKGVLQSLIEKHFPAPDSRKAFDLFGLQDKKSSIFDDMDLSSILGKTQAKRKAVHNTSARRGATAKEAPSDDEKSDKSSSEDDQAEETAEESSSNDDEEEDFNPFGGSDSDDDPWLKKSKAKSNGGGKKRKKENRQKPAKKQKSLDNSSYNEAKPSNGRRASESGESLSASDIDDFMDSVLGKSSNKMQEKLPAFANGFSSHENKSSGLTPEEAKAKASSMKRELLDMLDKLGDNLPANTLDELIDAFGGPDHVAEMTGRKGRIVTNENGGVNYELRAAQDVPLEILNLTEKQRFMDGEKYVAIISEAASSGISLQADRRVANQRRRLHITLELPWSADRAIQQFGRTHRSNQVSAPEYVFLISELAGERRFASTVAKRLECLGALTHGDRRATESRDLSQFNIDNKYGRAALEVVMKSIVSIEKPLVSPPSSYQGDFMNDIKESLVGVGLISRENHFGHAVLEKEYNVISKFLNRILGLPVEQQNALFQYFTDTLSAIILQAKRNGRFDLGILDLGAGSENVKVLSKKIFEQVYGGIMAKTELVTVSVERGMSWEQAMDIWRDHVESDDGFYITNNSRQGKSVAVLAVAVSGGKKKDKLYQVYRPNTGLAPKMESLSELKKRYKKVTPDHAEDIWLEQYQHSANMCTHMYFRGYCRKKSMGMSCEVGLRTRTYHVLTGSVLSVWNKIESVLASTSIHNQKMQIIRLRTDSGLRIVGTLIPTNSLTALTSILQQQK